MRLTGTRVALLGTVLGIACATVASDADASVSVAVLFDGLVAALEGEAARLCAGTLAKGGSPPRTATSISRAGIPSSTMTTSS